MVLTARDIIDEARLALRSDLDPRLAEMDFVNRVGRRWIGLHRWMYLQGRSFVVTTVAGQQTYTLPTDLSEVTAVYGEPGQVTPYEVVKMVSPEEWHAYDRQLLGGFFGRFVGYIDYAVVDDVNVPRLQLTPVPQEGRTLRLVYRAGWRPLVQGEDVADVPIWGEEAFRDLTRGLSLALHRVGADPSVDLIGPTIARVKASDEFQSAMSADGLAQPKVAKGMGALDEVFAAERRSNYDGPRFTTSDLLADL
ncbi:MAG: hypothetical protein AAF726_22330 [Planctomycetota bacterium]